jgi:hypothetical protein
MNCGIAVKKNNQWRKKEGAVETEKGPHRKLHNNQQFTVSRKP